MIYGCATVDNIWRKALDMVVITKVDITPILFVMTYFMKISSF